MSFSSVRRATFPDALPLERFARMTRRTLRSHGFTKQNSLLIVGACRDELSAGLTGRLQDLWGPAFSLSSLAGVPTYGAAPLNVALSHAPEDRGRRRVVAVMTTHIGVDRDGTIGVVRRDGQGHATSACGALVGLQRRLARAYREDQSISDEPEATLFRARVTHSIPAQMIRLGRRHPTLLELTGVARDVIGSDFPRLARTLVADENTVTALFTGIVIHGPEGDWVDPGLTRVYEAGLGRDIDPAVAAQPNRRIGWP